MSQAPLVDPALLAENHTLIPISDDEFEFFRKFLHERTGIHLTAEKRTLVAGRLQSLIRNLGQHSFAEYLQYLRDARDTDPLLELVNRISTNHTFFYRESDHFEFLVKTALPEIVPKLERSGSRDLRVWSAGCSSGEEPYNLVMMMKDFFGPQYPLWSAGVLATDLSARVLNLAKEGIYPADRISQLPPMMRQRYFNRINPQEFQVIEDVKKEVTFRQFNLMNKVFPFKKQFHVIFCRNVMIYFDQPTREALMHRFFNVTAPGGYLFIGHSESFPRERCPYEYVSPALYRKAE